MVDEKRNLHHVAWDKVCKLKFLERLEIRKLAHMNQAVIVKIDWALASEQDKFWVSILKAKYFLHLSFMHCMKRLGYSWSWFRILKSRDLLYKVFASKLVYVLT